MAIRNIVKLGDDILRKVCRTQLTFDDRLATVLDDRAWGLPRRRWVFCAVTVL